MKKTVTIICTNCPRGCEVNLTVEDEKIINIEGNKCKLGKTFAKKEYFNPTRILTTTMRVKNGLLPVIPVRSEEAIPKNKLYEAMKIIAKQKPEAPIEINQVLVKNIADTGINIIASRSLKPD